MSRLEIDAGKFRANFPESSFTIRHHLADSPLFELSRLVELSKSLPADCIEYSLGNVAVSQDPDQTPMSELSVEETIEQIESCQSWLVLKYVEQDPVYGALLDSCLAEMDVFSRPIVGAMDKKEAFIFITSPGSVTPFHFDPEHNFLLQVRGNKTMHTFDRNDRDLVPELSVERLYNPDATHRNLVFRDEDQQKATTYLLRPGDGLFVPQNAPHWVKNENNISISFSITFRSTFSERLARLYYVNSRLRRLGISPRPVLQSPLRDSVMDGGYRILRKIGALTRRK